MQKNQPFTIFMLCIEMFVIAVLCVGKNILSSVRWALVVLVRNT